MHADVEGDESAIRARLGETERLTRRAIQVVGTNGLEVLVLRLKSRDSRLKRFVRQCAGRLRVLDSETVLTAEHRRGQAIEAFYRLGKVALPAVPSLLELTRDPDPLTRSAATFALGGVAPNQWQALQPEHDRTN